MSLFTGPTELGGAINAPSDSNGYNTYMGFQFFPFSQSQGYEPQTCANACTGQTTYNSFHTNPDGTYQTCVFFNAYVLSENGVPQGLYCSLYNETWTRDYATNYGQYRGSDRYTVSRSYSYALTNPPNPSTSVPNACPSTSIVPNPSFENGVSPPTFWSLTATKSLTYGIVSPGSPQGGSKAFAVYFSPPINGGVSSLKMSTQLNTCAYHNYSITVDFKYDSSSKNFNSLGDCDLKIAYPHGTVQVSVDDGDAVPGQSPGVWQTTSDTFQAVSSSTEFDITISCNDQNNRYIVDNVVAKPYAGNAY